MCNALLYFIRVRTSTRCTASQPSITFCYTHYNYTVIVEKCGSKNTVNSVSHSVICICSWTLRQIRTNRSVADGLLFHYLFYSRLFSFILTIWERLRSVWCKICFIRIFLILIRFFDSSNLFLSTLSIDEMISCEQWYRQSLHCIVCSLQMSSRYRFSHAFWIDRFSRLCENSYYWLLEPNWIFFFAYRRAFRFGLSKYSSSEQINVYST